jgi:hypothetical protein
MLRFEAGAAYRGIHFVQKEAYSIAQGGEGAKVSGLNLCLHRCKILVS